MKHLIQNLRSGLLAAALLALGSLTSHAQQYNFATVTNNTGAPLAWTTATASNWNSSVSLTKFDSFVLETGVGTASTAAGGTLDIRFSTSNDGINWTTGLNQPGASGWFSLSPTNSAAGMAWSRTNIVVGSIGYWRIEWVTNNTGVTLTNFTIRAYVKPKRTG